MASISTYIGRLPQAASGLAALAVMYLTLWTLEGIGCLLGPRRASCTRPGGASG